MHVVPGQFNESECGGDDNEIGENMLGLRWKCLAIQYRVESPKRTDHQFEHMKLTWKYTLVYFRRH